MRFTAVCAIFGLLAAAQVYGESVPASIQSVSGGPAAMNMTKMAPPAVAEEKKVEPTEVQKKAAVKKIVNEHLLFEISRDNPELAKKLEQVKKQDSEEFARLMDEYARKSSQVKKQKTEEFRKLVEDYLLNPSEQLKTEIKARLGEVYDRKISWEKGVIARQEEKLKARQDKLKKIEAERDTLIDEQFEKITQWQW